MAFIQAFTLIATCFLCDGAGCLSFALEAAADTQRTEFWYDAPASDWTAAIPLGNGRIGAMVYGDPTKETILLNENSIWCGPPFAINNVRGPELVQKMRQLLFEGRYLEAEELCADEFLDGKAANDRANHRSYQPMAFLHLDFGTAGGYGSSAAGAGSGTDGPETVSSGVRDYVRWLDYENSVTCVSYSRDGVSYLREAFVSAPDQVLAIRLSASRPGSISFEAGASREGNVSISAESNCLQVKGRAEAENGDFKGVRFEGRAEFHPTGGSITAKNGKIRISGADEVLVLVAIETDYNLDNPLKPLKRNLTAACRKTAAAAAKLGFGRLSLRHRADYRDLYDRFGLELSFDEESRSGNPAAGPGGIRENVPGAGLPLDRRIASAASGVRDHGLPLLFLRYCRYLLISSSRSGGLPMNLQGIWNPMMKAPWRSNFHLNINIEEAYWFAEQGGLGECHEPLFTLTEKLAEDGRNTARTVLGTGRGFAAGHRTDVWFPSRIIGYKPCHGMYVMSGGWLTQHLMEHWRFTQDKEFLRRRALPLLRDAALFFVDWLVEDPRTGLLVSGPGASAENTFLVNGGRASLSMGCTHDQEVIWNCFTDCLEACGVLGISEPWTDEIRDALARLALPRIGSDGRLMEWAEEFEEAEPGHRHLSHLFGMMPGHRISLDLTPELAEAVRKSLNYRLSHGYDAQGWSLGWTVCLLARLREGDRALAMLESDYFRKAFPNGFVNAHGHVQVGDMMGAPLAMMEFLLQSQNGYLDLLPALPGEWHSGKVSGMRARGGFKVDIVWKEGRMEYAEVIPNTDGSCSLRYLGRSLEVPTQKGKVFRVVPEDFGI